MGTQKYKRKSTSYVKHKKGPRKTHEQRGTNGLVLASTDVILKAVGKTATLSPNPPTTQGDFHDN